MYRQLALAIALMAAFSFGENALARQTLEVFSYKKMMKSLSAVSDMTEMDRDSLTQKLKEKVAAECEQPVQKGELIFSRTPMDSEQELAGGGYMSEDLVSGHFLCEARSKLQTEEATTHLDRSSIDCTDGFGDGHFPTPLLFTFEKNHHLALKDSAGTGPIGLKCEAFFRDISNAAGTIDVHLRKRVKFGYVRNGRKCYRTMTRIYDGYLGPVSTEYRIRDAHLYSADEIVDLAYCQS